jgi:hypothetical protein
MVRLHGPVYYKGGSDPWLETTFFQSKGGEPG